MPVIVLETRDLTSPLFLVRMWELLSSGAAFSLVASVGGEGPNQPPPLQTFWIFCMFTWCFFFTLTLLILVLSVFQFHRLLRVSWKNLTASVSALGALMTLSGSVFYSWGLLDRQRTGARGVAAAVASCLAVCAYVCESVVLRRRPPEERGYMSSAPGVLKLLQLWGGCQMVPLLVEVARQMPDGARHWSVWVPGTSYGVCALTAGITVGVILGDGAGRCPLPFERLLAAFSLTGLVLYTLATVVCVTEMLHVVPPTLSSVAAQTVLMETAVCCVTLLAYTVDFAFSVKLLFDRSHM